MKFSVQYGAEYFKRKVNTPSCYILENPEKEKPRREPGRSLFLFKGEQPDESRLSGQRYAYKAV